MICYFLIEKKSPNKDEQNLNIIRIKMKFNRIYHPINPPNRICGGSDTVGQDHGKGNHVPSSTLPSLRTGKILSVATIRFLPKSSPASTVKGKGQGDMVLLFVFFQFLMLFILFFYFFNIPKIKWTKFEEQLNFRGRWVLSLVSGPH